VGPEGTNIIDFPPEVRQAAYQFLERALRAAR
jgi:hypothetical protein